MEIIVDREPIAIVSLDIKKFKQEFAKDFRLKKAFNKSKTVKVVDFEIKQRLDVLSKYVFLSVDWTNLFMMTENNNIDTTNISVYKCQIKGLTTYTPDQIDIESAKFTFKDKKTDFVEFLVIGNYVNKIDKHIEYMLSQNLIDYVNFNWKMLFKINT